MRRLLKVVTVGAVLALQVGVVTPPAGANGTLGGFEIDGNLADDSGPGDPIDWASPPPNLTSITDPAASTKDDIFGNGSKELDPSSWTCVKQKPPGKDDIVSGKIAFRRLNGDQFAYTNFFRKDVNGDAHMDFEFNKVGAPVNASCPVPARTPGDLLIAFDTENGGAQIFVRVFRWSGSDFVETPSSGLADGAVNIPPSLTIPGHANGDFGEAVVNLTQTIGDVTCGEFAGAYMKTRSSTSITAALKDFTRPQPINPDACPSSALDKAVRNVSTNGTFGNTATATPGQTLEYRLRYTNTGQGPASNVVISDTLQPRQTWLSCSPACTTTGTPVSAVSWTFPSIAAGATQDVFFRVTLDATFPAGTTTVSNTATVSTTQEGTKPSDTTTTTVTANPRSTLAKAVRDVTSGGTFGTSTDAAPGDTVEYRLTYSNSGNAAATNVVLSDPVPARTTYLSCSDSCATTGSPVSGVSWTFASVAPGETKVVTFQVRLDSTGFTQGQTVPVTNVAQFCTAQEGCGSSNTTTVNVKTPNDALVKAVRNVTSGSAFGTSTTAAPGDTLEYRLTLTNNGTAPATNVVVSDVVQAHQTYLSCTASCSTSGSPVTGVSWSFPSVAPGETKTMTFQVQLDATFPAGTTAVKDTATVVSSEEPQKTSNETTTSVTAAPVSALAKAVRDVTTGTAFGSSTDASPGDTIEYRLTYTNSGNAPASNVVISDPVPARTTYVSCSNSCTTTGSPVTSVSWTFASVAPGQTQVVTFQVRLDQTGFTAGSTTPVTNVAQVCTAEEACTNSPPTSVNVKTPKSALAKAVRDVTTSSSFGTLVPASPGDTVEYRLTYTNSGPGTATGVVVSDPVPARTTYVSCSSTCTTDGPPVTTVTWAIGTVAPGTSVVVTFQVRLDAVFPSGTTDVTNVGSARTNEETGTTSSNPATVRVTAAPNLTLAKAADATSTVVAGDHITYTLTYGNSGNATATGSTLTETVPAGTTYDSCTGGCTVSGSTVTWSLGSVQPGGSGTVTLTVVVSSTVGCSICNVAHIASPAQGGGTPVASNQVCVTAQPAPNPAGAHASGSGLGAAVTADLPLVGAVNQRLSESASSQTGPGVSSDEHRLPLDPLSTNPVKVPSDGSLLTADVLWSNSTSRVTTSPAEAEDIGTAEVLGVKVANGLVTADVVRAVATATATGDSSSYSSVGSTFTNLKVQGVALTDVAPNTTIAVGDVTGLGLGVSVVLREESGSATGPAATQLSGGTYAADSSVTMIHVHVDDGNLLKGGKQPIDILVSQAKAHADFPQTLVCNANPTRTVSGHAFIASESTNPSLAPVTVGYTSIPASGGLQEATLDSLLLPDDGSVATGTAADSMSSGALGATSTSSYDVASAAQVCITLTGSGCDVYATAVRSVSDSTASAGGAASSAVHGTDATTLLGLVIAGTPVAANPPPNTAIPIPGVATVILNEQVCDNGGTLAKQCADGTVAGHAGLTVRAIHVILFDPVAGPGGEVTVAEAHSDATWR